MRNYLFLFAAILLIFASCNNGDKAFKEYLATADSTQFPSNITDLHSSSRKILYSADLDYRVQDVLKATTQTEQWVKGLGGVVAKSEMRNMPVSEKDIAYKSDSLKHTQIYTPVASLVIKVPVEKLDSLTALLSANAQFVIHRTIAQQDVTFTYLSNALKNQKAESPGKPVHYTAPATDANTVLAGNTSDEKQADEQVIDRKIENLQLLDEINYATVSINFTQPERIEVQVIADANYATSTPLGTQLLVALSSGTTVLRDVLLIIVTLWPLWIIVLIVWAIYKRYRKPQLIQKQV